MKSDRLKGLLFSWMRVGRGTGQLRPGPYHPYRTCFSWRVM